MTETVEVLIVGAGPVGLSLAIELGHRGIHCLLVERNDRVGYNPRAKTTNVRTREHLRRWGIADALRRASPLPEDYPPNVVFATRMNGPRLALFENAFCAGREKNDLYSEGAQWVPQFVLEEVLRERAGSFDCVDIRFNTALESFDEATGGVVATLRDTRNGEEMRVHSHYLVGADGARSQVRARIEAKLVGEHSFSANLNFVFKSTRLASMHQHGPAIMYWMINEDVPSLLGPMSGDGLWYFIATNTGADADAATIDAADLIRRATGLDIDIEIVGRDPWVAHRLIADRYSRGHVFLAGDACHLHPPFGGYGMNTGIGDAVDLGWKLAATLQGWGGDRLLATYEEERRPIHELAVSEALANYATVSNQLARPGIEAPGFLGDATRREVSETILTSKTREIRSLGMVKGYRYSGSSIIAPDGTPEPLMQSMVYEPSAHPGCVAPHIWLADGSSLYDHFGPGFSLLLLDDSEDPAIADFQAAAEKIGLPLTLVRPGDPRLPRRYQAAYALIRPDQHVAWRGNHLPTDPVALLDHVRGTA